MFLCVLSVPEGGCLARVVTVSPGPLIRVEGQPVSVRCDVNDYGGPREQVGVFYASVSPVGARAPTDRSVFCE